MRQNVQVYLTSISTWLIFFAVSITQCYAANPIFFCKCFCGSNSTIFEIPMGDQKPCSNCTKQYCLDNVQDGLCDGIADETCPSNDFRTSCFARDSVKDEAIVCLFLILTGGLVVSAALKPYYQRWRSVIYKGGWGETKGKEKSMQIDWVCLWLKIVSSHPMT